MVAFMKSQGKTHLMDGDDGYIKLMIDSPAYSVAAAKMQETYFKGIKDGNPEDKVARLFKCGMFKEAMEAIKTLPSTSTTYKSVGAFLESKPAIKALTAEEQRALDKKMNDLNEVVKQREVETVKWTPTDKVCLLLLDKMDSCFIS
jgi:hypothetical protein